ncbi:hypothetical protein GOV11_00120 [Candidatus Woesearchaeota archaeon]|nr:hypothetical protein [Candidatus Woesearchaeota archaeon]
MRRGQLGQSFQWIFVIVAGGAFLVFFAMLFRTCAQIGDEQIKGINIYSVSEKLQSGAWKGDTVEVVTIEESLASCPADSVTIIGGGQAAPMDRAPVFIPPALGGEMTIVTRRAEIARNTESPIIIGGVVYAFDQDTYYIVVQDIQQQEWRKLIDILPDGLNIKLISSGEVRDIENLQVPESAKTAVLVSTNPANLDLMTQGLKLPSKPDRYYGVMLNFKDTTSDGGGTARFYVREGDRFVPARKNNRLNYATYHLATGAMVAADYDNFRCANEAFTERLRIITTLHEFRARIISDTLLEDDQFRDPYCAANLRIAAEALYRMNTGDGDEVPDNEKYLELFATHSGKLSHVQRGLLDSGCPVIA